ncbi:hypothetical protein [Pantanalinema sp. GBBB05]|uniref:hypothetical protein n=1 Tax=Pantanalinema sp. GBBB05 TaxID=2604139 RepID=UPI001DB9F121|nr:hypothetical protein [Pantanalinema sp. GBBB05]
MRKLAQVTVLTAFSTLLGFIPLAAYAQSATQVVICSGQGVKGNFTFKLNGKAEALQPGKCGTFSGASTFLFYTEYGRNPRLILERQLRGGGRYQIELDNPPNTKPGRYEVVPVQFERT